MVKENEKILLVGCGHMGFAMLKSWKESNFSLHVVEPQPGRHDAIKKCGATVWEDINAIPKSFTPDLIILAVIPQIIDTILPAYRLFSKQGVAFLSIAAGVTLNHLGKILGPETALIRAMPNLPVAITEGVIICCANAAVKQKSKKSVETLLTHCGEQGWVEDEKMIDAVTAISGSGPAYLFYFMEAFEEAAKELGLPASISHMACLQTIIGTALLMRSSDKTASQWRYEVAVEKGTTEAALKQLMRPDGLKYSLKTAIKAAHQRSLELGSSHS